MQIGSVYKVLLTKVNGTSRVFIGQYLGCNEDIHSFLTESGVYLTVSIKDILLYTNDSTKIDGELAADKASKGEVNFFS